MNCNAIFILLLCIGAATAFEWFTFRDREPGDRPIYIYTIETDPTEASTQHVASYEWFGVNQTFTQIYVEASSWDYAILSQPGDYYPTYKRNFKLEVVSSNTTQLTVSFIVFGFVNQPPTHPGVGISLLPRNANMVVERKFREV